MNRTLVTCSFAMLSAFVGTSRADSTHPGPINPIDTDAPPSRYSVVKDEAGVWWFQSPNGTRFYSLGINNISSEPFQPRPETDFYNPVPTEFKGDLGAWATFAKQLLLDSGFNTIGAWSSTAIQADETLHTTPVLYVVEHEGTRCLTPLRPDFEEFVLRNVKVALDKLPNRKGLLGVFLDNEMPWYGKSGWDDIPTYTLLEQALELPSTDVRRMGAIDFLKSRHPDIAHLANAYGRPVASWQDLNTEYMMRCTTAAAHSDRDQFTAMLANRFYEVSTRIVRAELPNVLILGTRIPGNAPDPVIRACGRTCDVMSVNSYRTEPKVDVNNLTRFWLLGGKPLMHTEYSWRAKQNNSRNPNSRGAGPVVESQADRAAAYSSMVSDIATVPYVIGSHWFEFADQSPQGRFDGEDSNYGVVDVHNTPYAELLSAMKSTNARAMELHAKTTRVMPTQLPTPKVVTYSPGQHPGRAAKLDLLGEWTHEPEIWGAPDSKLTWKRDGEHLVLIYDAGAQYGAGINLFGPKLSALTNGPAFATDIDGYSHIVMVADAPQGVQLNIVLAEAGSAVSSNSQFDARAGDDGEAFISPPVFGEGKQEAYRIPISSLLKQQFFGNKNGAGRIDMQAIRNLGIQVSGAPRRGDVVVHKLSLER